MTASEATPVPVRKPALIPTILREIWSSRELLEQLVRRDLRLRYRQAVMGFAWALFLPMLTVGAGLVVRAAMSRGGAVEGVPSVGGIAIKSWAWAFFAGAMNFGTVSLLSNMGLVTKIYFPREVLPVASITTQGIDSLLSLSLLLLAGPWIGFHWSLQVLWVPILILMLVVFTTGLAFLFACANLFFRDVKYILQVLMTFGIFLTPVLLEPASFSPRIGRLLMLNPLSSIFEGLRLVMVERADILHTVYDAHGLPIWSPWHLAYTAVISIIVLLTGLVAFRKSASMFAEYY